MNHSLIEPTIQRLHWLCTVLPSKLQQIPEEELKLKPNPEKWSKQEILGHLIDSAANNHQRFVRVQFEQQPVIGYDQNLWSRFSYHNNVPAPHLLNLFVAYNWYLADVLSQIPDEALQRTCILGNGNSVTLQWIAEDYLRHLEHHLHQILDY